MTWSPSSVLTLHRSVQLKLNSDVNWTIKLTQKQISASTKRNCIRWCQQCNKAGAIGRIERDLLRGYKLRTNYVINTTNVSSCDLEQVTQLNIQTKNTSKRNNATLHVSCLIKVDNSKTRMKWHKILVSDIMTLSKWLKSDEVWISWTEWYTIIK